MKLITTFLTLLLATTPCWADEKPSEHADKTLEIYRTIIGMETANGLGNVPAMATYLADELKDAGIPEQDIEVVPQGETASLVARYRGDDLDHWSIILKALASSQP